MQTVYVVVVRGSPNSDTSVASPLSHFHTRRSCSPPRFLSSSNDLLATCGCLQPSNGAAPQCGSGVGVDVEVAVLGGVDVAVAVGVEVGVRVAVEVGTARFSTKRGRCAMAPSRDV